METPSERGYLDFDVSSVDDFTWTLGDDSDQFLHRRKIDAGASGEVHEVSHLNERCTR